MSLSNMRASLPNPCALEPPLFQVPNAKMTTEAKGRVGDEKSGVGTGLTEGALNLQAIPIGNGQLSEPQVRRNVGY